MSPEGGFKFAISNNNAEPSEPTPATWEKELTRKGRVRDAREALSDLRAGLAEIEKDIAIMLHDASEVYGNDEVALKLRQMHLLNESMQRTGGSVVVPSAYAEGFTNPNETAGGGLS